MGRVLDLHWLSHMTSLVRSSVPDLVLVSRESRQLSTWRLLLVLHSPSLAKLLQSCTAQQDEFTAISVPASTAQLTDLLAALETTGEMEEVEDTLAARLLGIKTTQRTSPGEKCPTKYDFISVPTYLQKCRTDIKEEVYNIALSSISSESDDYSVNNSVRNAEDIVQSKCNPVTAAGLFQGQEFKTELVWAKPWKKRRLDLTIPTRGQNHTRMTITGLHTNCYTKGESGDTSEET